MATKAIGMRGASLVGAWATFAAILAVGAASAVAGGLIGRLTDLPTGSAALQGLVRLSHGDLLLRAAEIRGMALIAFGGLGLPLAVLALMLLIERTAGPSEREPKDHLLAWQVQALFYGFSALLAYALSKLAPLPWRPLIQIEAGEGVAGTLFKTLPAFLLILLAIDFFRYWFHRAQHRFAILWRFHSVHHAPRDLDVFHNINHPIELVGEVFFMWLPMSLLIGMNGGSLYGLAVLFTVQGHIHHMNVPMHYGPFLRHFLADNRYHFVHHSTDPRDFDTNFAGMFPVWDRVFGTYREPRPGPLPETGLSGDPPTRLTHYLLGRRSEQNSRSQ